MTVPKKRCPTAGTTPSSLVMWPNHKQSWVLCTPHHALRLHCGCQCSGSDGTSKSALGDVSATIIAFCRSLFCTLHLATSGLRPCPIWRASTRCIAASISQSIYHVSSNIFWSWPHGGTSASWYNTVGAARQRHPCTGRLVVRT